MRQTVATLLVLIISNFVMVDALKDDYVKAPYPEIKHYLLLQKMQKEAAIKEEQRLLIEKSRKAEKKRRYLAYQEHLKRKEAKKQKAVAAAKLKRVSQSVERKGVSNSDKELLARLVTAEAKNQPFEGQVAVAAVVLNRVESAEWQDSVSSVIYAKRQFQPVSNGSINRKATDSARKAVEEALKGSDPSHGAVYFYNPAIAKGSPSPRSKKTAVIGDHVFLN